MDPDYLRHFNDLFWKRYLDPPHAWISPTLREIAMIDFIIGG
jgi:hypothetical protein